MLVKAAALRKSYKEGAEGELTVIHGLDAEFPSASKNAIVGMSGIGKSTLLHLLGGLDLPTSGKVYYGDTDIFSLNDEERSALRGNKVGFVFQFHHLLPEFTALENAAMPLLIADGGEEAIERARVLLTEVGLAARLSHRPGQLSGGEQQRVAIARALVVQPALLLADEPTGNLDLKTAAEVQELLMGITSRYNTTVVIATHNLELAKSMQNVYEMRPGGQLLDA